MLNKRYIKSIKRDIFLFWFPFQNSSFNFFSAIILERKDKKWFKRDIIVLISFLILFVSISFLVNIGKEMSLPGFRTVYSVCVFREPLSVSLLVLRRASKCSKLDLCFMSNFTRFAFTQTIMGLV